MKEDLTNNLFEDLKTLYIIIINKGIENDIVKLYSEKINNIFKIFGIDYSSVKFNDTDEISKGLDNIYTSIDNIRMRKNLFEDDCEILDYILDDLTYLLKTKF